MSEAEFQSHAGSPTPVAQESLAWYRAVTLAERLCGGQSARRANSLQEVQARMQAIDDERVQFCLSSWKAQKPFDDPEHFTRRLRHDQLTERDLSDLIAEPPADIRQRLAAVPAWMTVIETALSSWPTFEFHDLMTDRFKKKPTIGFLDLAAPFIDPALHQLETAARQLARRHRTCPFDPATVGALFFPHLATSLLRIVSRTMVLELNVARLTGTLAGSTAEDRFASFITQLHAPDRLRELFEEYPVLGRLIAEATTRWVDVSLEFLERLATDRPSLEAAFGTGGALGPLVGATGGLADPHHGGRSVLIAAFASGTRIVYKPTSLSVDAHFQHLLHWVSARGFTPEFRALTMLDRGGYGWMEFASRASCHTTTQVSRFYERAGGLLALLYVTEGTDLHAGNLIASGEHPVLIDLEALFHPHRSPQVIAESASADTIASQWIRSSVLRIGLLPERQWANSEHEGVDISGLGAREGQLTPHGVPEWEAAGTDTMRLVRRRKAIEADSNQPLLNGRPVDVLDHRAALVRGFRLAYTILADHRDRLLSSDGPLRPFARDAVSVFLRPSRTYRKLLAESYHPDVLRDALDRDRLFDLLWIEVSGDPELEGVIRSEQRDLWNGDIPCFSARPASRDLHVGETRTIADFFGESSLSSVERIAGRLSPTDCTRQVWLIEASLASLPGSLVTSLSETGSGPTTHGAPDRLLGGALAIGRRLDQLAVRNGDTASWIGLDCDHRGVWSIAKAGLDLDAGVPGITLFLSYLGAVTGLEAPSSLARAGLATLQELIERRAASLSRIGGYDGLGSVIYTLSHLAALWERPDLASVADALAARLPERIDEDDHFDVFAGASGSILALRSLHGCLPSERVTATAIQCGDHLIRSALPTAEGIGWPGLSDGPGRWGRLAHGPMGVGFALLELYAWTQLDRFRDAAVAALDSERGRLSPLCKAPARMAHLGGQTDIEALAATVRDYGAESGGARLDCEPHLWRCRTPHGVETPGLLAGLAGIGYGLLRAARPDVVPCVLTLESPRTLWRAHGG